MLIPLAACDEANPGWNNTYIVDDEGTPQGVVFVDGKPRVVSTEYTYQIAEGAIPDHYAVRRFGKNDDVGGAWETIYTLSDLYTYLAAAEQWKIRSSSASDNATGTGAQTLFIQGLDGNYNRISETINLAGTAYVTTAKSYLRLFQSYVVDVGAIGANAGDIEFWNNAEAHQLDEIILGEGQLHTAIFTVPADNTFYTTDYTFGESTNKGMVFSLWIREFGESWRLVREFPAFQANYQFKVYFPFNLPAKCDVEMRVQGVTVAGTAYGGFDGWYE